MSGYGVATVIVEANEHSGTRAQARQAQHHGRPIIIRDRVFEQTEWGKRLEGNPSVYVVSTVEDVSRAIDVILDSDSLLEDTMRRMITQATEYTNRYKVK